MSVIAPSMEEDDIMNNQNSGKQQDGFIMNRYVKNTSELSHEHLCARWADNHWLSNLAFLYFFGICQGIVALIAQVSHALFGTHELPPLWCAVFIPVGILALVAQDSFLQNIARRKTREELVKDIKKAHEIRDESPI